MRASRASSRDPSASVLALRWRRVVGVLLVMPPPLDPPDAASPPAAPHADGTSGEDALLLLAQRGDQAAFAQLLQSLTPRLRRLFAGMGGPQGADIDELVQEASLQLYRALPRYVDMGRGPQVARAWCYKVAVNVALMQQRRARRSPSLALGEGFGLLADGQAAHSPAPGWAPRPDDGASLREQGRDLDVALERLPDKYRLVLWLADVEGHKLDDVAVVMGITLPTVKARLLRARGLVRQRVGKRRPLARAERPAP